MATLHRTEVLTFPAESIQLYITNCSRLAARPKLQVSCGSSWDELGAARIPLRLGLLWDVTVLLSPVSCKKSHPHTSIPMPCSGRAQGTGPWG